MENCKACDNVEAKKNSEDFKSNLKKLRKQGDDYPFYRPIDITRLKMSLYKALLMPELAKGIRFVYFY